MSNRRKPADLRAPLVISGQQLTAGTRAMIEAASKVAVANNVPTGELYMHRGGIGNAVDFAAEAMRAAAAGDLREFVNLIECANDFLRRTAGIRHTDASCRVLPMKGDAS